MGDVVGFPLRVLRLRTTSVARWWEAPLETTVARRPASADRPATMNLEGTLAGAHSFGRVLPKG
jgi:hypothetical protein